LSFGVVGGGGDLRIGVLQALQINTLVGTMVPRVKGDGICGDLAADTKSRVGRLFARVARLERDLDLERVVVVEGSGTLRRFGAMAVIVGC
jgi:hypothetical protein